MSSHHIVRENQEPALLVQDFRALEKELLDQLLEWSPTIITDTYSLDFFLSEEIKVDIVFAGMPIPYLQEETMLFSLEGSFFDTAIPYLISKSYPAVNILCSEMDDTIIKYAEDINMVVFCENRRYVFVKRYYEKWKPKGEKIFVDPRVLKSQEGLRPTGGQSFETETDGFFSLIFNTETFVCIGEEV
ncbi:thiamine diphosphokinase [Sphingobacterium faecale]|uniref:Thiamine diphosphokinase n=1 Tax=Sphingobacterium faecale TaxID=2803775 RepID=A0ABS1R9J9_9SPHI|nr:thiamine diphosphokinase [Sphingobacterium faecale]MBL1411395.1 thiamine diphosphokinase [Sphingobacterium faecale]